MSEKTNISWDKLDALILDAQSILLTTHVNPDGDGLGSEAALYHHISGLQKDVKIINSSSLPYQYCYLNHGDIISTYDGSQDEWLSQVDLVIVLDIGDAHRIGELREFINPKAVSVSIDHHPLKNGFEFTHVIIDTEVPAAGVLIWNYLNHVRDDSLLPVDISDALYTALVTDTGSFRYSNTTAKSHEMAMHLLQSGTEPSKINRLIFERRQLPQVKLLGKVINNLKFSDCGRIVYFRITQDSLKECGAKPADVNGFTDYARSIDGVEVSFMVLEVDDERIRVNFRSKGKVTVNDIAMMFHGGGHRFAAGTTFFNKTLDYAEETILSLLLPKFETDEYNNMTDELS